MGARIKMLKWTCFDFRNGLSYNLAQLIPDIPEATYDSNINYYIEDDQAEYLPNQIVTLLTVMKKQREGNNST